jgi:glycosyltransferase involved in cell wall biosynthesis
MRGESNALRQQGSERSEEPRKRQMSHAVNGRQMAKRVLLGQLFKRVDHFLCIGTANRELYRSYRVPESKLHMAMYAVDNKRFAAQAATLRDQRSEIRRRWRVPKDAFCVLFCGKFIPKKHPMDLVKAAQMLLASHPDLKIHLLFAGSGELGAELRANCKVMFDAESPDNRERITDNAKPAAAFTGFLNQTQVSKAYVAADCLVLSSDYSETWGLVVNEAMASGLSCIISDRCGCAPDLGNACGNAVFSFGNISDLATEIVELTNRHGNRSQALELPSFSNVVDVVAHLYG